mgnify:CR=1 FL=1
MGDMSFTWRGVSSDVHGVIVRSLPAPTSGPQRHTAVVVPGRHGALHLMENARDEVLLNIECYLPYEQGVPVSDLRTIAGWLSGSGRLTLSDQPGVYFEGTILDAISYQPVIPGFEDRLFSLPVWVKPHAYVAGVSDIVMAVSGAEVVNPYTAESEPAIKVVGSGDITLDVGGVDVELDVDGYITLDCEARLAHKDGALAGSRVNLSEWPTLKPGRNVISWTGVVTAVTISPRWRWV